MITNVQRRDFRGPWGNFGRAACQQAILAVGVGGWKRETTTSPTPVPPGELTRRLGGGKAWYSGYQLPKTPRYTQSQLSPPQRSLLGSFSNGGGDSSENVKKTIGLISKTTTLHVHHAFLYISLRSRHDYDVKMPNFTFYGGRKQATTNCSFSFKPSVWSPRN